MPTFASLTCSWFCRGSDRRQYFKFRPSFSVLDLSVTILSTSTPTHCHTPLCRHQALSSTSLLAPRTVVPLGFLTRSPRSESIPSLSVQTRYVLSLSAMDCWANLRVWSMALSEPSLCSPLAIRG